ncbi:protein kinase [Gemmatimonadota bacterium]
MASSQDTEERLKAALADRYRIEREIGSGGMATVYLAQDPKHDRKVAVKVLDPELAQSVGAERFLREIKIAANLHHPHILPVHDSGEADGFLYFVMPFVEGESLQDRLTRERQLPVEDALRITREIAEALDYAHERRVIHRDVKPANIMLEAGHAILADFGVAHAVAEAKDERITRTGMSVGTPAYMSPEQATGEQHLDGRSDQYALGCVLYEMLSGDAPYLASTPQAVIAKKLSDPVPRISVVRETVPASLEEALNKALARNPVDRFKTAGLFAEALAQARATLRTPSRFGRTRAAIYAGTVILGLATVAVIASRRSSSGPGPTEDVVLVTPMENRTGDPALDPYGDWAADHITSGLMDAQLTKVVPFRDMAAAQSQTPFQSDAQPSLSQSWHGRFGATLAVRGAFYAGPSSDSIEFRLEVVGSDGTVQGTVPPVRCAREDPTEALAALQVQVVGAVAGIVVPGHQFDLLARGRRPPNLGAFLAMTEAWEVFARSQETAVPLIQRATEIDSLYFPPLFLLRAVYSNLGRYAEADSVCRIMEERIHWADAFNQLTAEYQCPNLRAEDRTSLEIARDLVKMRPGQDYFLGLELLRLNRPREAVEAFANYDATMGSIYREWEDTNARYWAEALHLLGEHSRELEVVTDVRRRFPEESRLIIAEIRARAALGQIPEVEGLVDEAIRSGARPAQVARIAALELKAHENQDASPAILERALSYLTDQSAEVTATRAHRADVADILYWLERWDESQAISEELAREAPAGLDDLIYLGTLAAHRGDRQEAERISAEIASMELPYDRGYSTYQRACIAAILGDKERAVSLLRQAHEEGRAFTAWLHIDSDLDSLRGYPPFEEFMRPKG